MSDIDNFFLGLVRLGVGHPAEIVAADFDWNEIQTLANSQGLTAIVLDGVEQLKVKSEELKVKSEEFLDEPSGKAERKVVISLPPKPVMVQWIGEVLQNFEYRYELYRRAIAEMAAFYNGHGCKMMVLKGFSCSLNWPKPEHRPTGDIDIWQFGDYKKADALLTSEKCVVVDNSHHHHTVFHWRDFMVENHYDFINVHHHKSNVKLEKELKRLGKDDSHFVKVYGEKVYLPSPNLHALFLLKHTMNDFTSFSMTIRQLLDWAFYVEKYGKEIDWKWLEGIVEKYHMKDFFNCVNAICVEELGFEFDVKVNVDKELKERVLKDILHPEFSVTEPSKLLPRLAYKYRRWKGNAWKHCLCYNESLWSAFWSGVWAHLLKPGSI